MSEPGGIAPSTNSRLPMGAINDAPRLVSSFQPSPEAKPSAAKKLARRSYAAALPAGRRKEIPLIMIRFYRGEFEGSGGSEVRCRTGNLSHPGDKNVARMGRPADH